MLSVTRELRVDEELLKVEQYPVEEISLLRNKTLASISGPMAEVVGKVAGVSGTQLDIEVSFNWAFAGGVIPAGAEVGVVVLMGSEERTVVSLKAAGAE